ncbi:hypothetical protein GGS20DRAFT_414954 [Poronia punctata]|nr:hypothetical protein GGS20DRAFT_414954 [Poronia punctata]
MSQQPPSADGAAPANSAKSESTESTCSCEYCKRQHTGCGPLCQFCDRLYQTGVRRGWQDCSEKAKVELNKMTEQIKRMQLAGQNLTIQLQHLIQQQARGEAPPGPGHHTVAQHRINICGVCGQPVQGEVCTICARRTQPIQQSSTFQLVQAASTLPSAGGRGALASRFNVPSPEGWEPARTSVRVEYVRAPGSEARPQLRPILPRGETSQDGPLPPPESHPSNPSV